MGTLTKVLIVLNFIFAVVMFCVQAVLFAQREDWKMKWVEEANNHTKTIMVKDAEIQYQIRENNSKDTLIASLSTRINELITEVENTKRSLNDKTNDLSNLQRAFDNLAANYNEMKTHMQTLESARSNLQRQYEEISERFNQLAKQKDTSVQELLTLKQKLDSVNAQAAELETRIAALIKEKKDLELIIANLEKMGIQVNILPEKPVRGKVVSYDETRQVAAIDVGKDHGVQVAQKFSIIRGSNFVASGKVIDVERDYSILKIEYTQLKPEIGDSCTNVNTPPGTFDKPK